MYVAIVTALLAAFASLMTITFTRHKEREAAWRSKKLAYYEEFFAAAGGIVGLEAAASAQTRFANAVNNPHLIASGQVLTALHRFCDEISASNRQRSADRHDALWSTLVWQIRSDLNDPPTKDPTEFHALLWSAGAPEELPDRH